MIQTRTRVFANAYGTTDVVIGSAHVALSAGGVAIAQQTDRTLTFSGSRSLTIPPSALAVSDAVTLDLPPLTDVAVSLYLPGDLAAATARGGAADNHI